MKLFFFTTLIYLWFFGFILASNSRQENQEDEEDFRMNLPPVPALNCSIGFDALMLFKSPSTRNESKFPVFFAKLPTLLMYQITTYLLDPKSTIGVLDKATSDSFKLLRLMKLRFYQGNTFDFPSLADANRNDLEIKRLTQIKCVKDRIYAFNFLVNELIIKNSFDKLFNLIAVHLISENEHIRSTNQKTFYRYQFSNLVSHTLEHGRFDLYFSLPQSETGLFRLNGKDAFDAFKYLFSKPDLIARFRKLVTPGSEYQTKWVLHSIFNLKTDQELLEDLVNNRNDLIFDLIMSIMMTADIAERDYDHVYNLISDMINKCNSEQNCEVLIGFNDVRFGYVEEITNPSFYLAVLALLAGKRDLFSRVVADPNFSFNQVNITHLNNFVRISIKYLEIALHLISNNPQSRLFLGCTNIKLNICKFYTVSRIDFTEFNEIFNLTMDLNPMNPDCDLENLPQRIQILFDELNDQYLVDKFRFTDEDSLISFADFMNERLISLPITHLNHHNLKFFIKSPQLISRYLLYNPKFDLSSKDLDLITPKMKPLLNPLLTFGLLNECDKNIQFNRIELIYEKTLDQLLIELFRANVNYPSVNSPKPFKDHYYFSSRSAMIHVLNGPNKDHFLSELKAFWDGHMISLLQIEFPDLLDK